MQLDLRHKTVVYEKLIPFGFVPRGGNYIYKTDILDGQFELEITVLQDGRAETRLTEKALGEEYVLHLIPEAAGEFVGSVRSAVGEATARFFRQCCETDIFRSDQARRVIAYIREKYGAEPEFLWEKFPENAVFRRGDTNKWYAALLTVPRRKLGFGSDGPAEILDLRIQPEQLPALLGDGRYLPGYHMNKKSWFTVVLDGGVSCEEIFARIDESYRLASGKKR